MLAGALISAAAVFLLWPHLHGTETYRDVVVGILAWQDMDKRQDYLALYLFFLGTFLLSILVAIAFRRFRNRPRAVSSSPDVLILFVALPSLWRLAIAGSYGQPYELTTGQIGLAAISVAVALGLWIFSQRGSADDGRDWRVHGWTGFAAALGFFALLGIMTAATRLSPALLQRLPRRIWVAPLAAAIGAGFMAWRTFRITGEASGQARQALLRLFLILQAPVVLLLFALLPPPIYQRRVLIPPVFGTALPAVLAGAALLTWWMSYRTYASAKRSGFAVATGCPVDQRVLSPGSMAAIAIFVLLPYLRLPTLPGAENYLHFGEEALPWQQWIAFGKIPYVDLIPVHGLMAFLRGFLNQAFLDGTAASHDAATLLMLAMAIAALFFTARPLIGTVMATVIAAMGYAFSDRFFFLVPALLLLANPSILEKPARWLVVWIFAAPILVFYNAPIGIAYTLGTLPAAVLMFSRVIQTNRKALPIILACMGLLAVTLLLFHEQTFGLVQFVVENQKVNDVANSIAWSDSLKEELSLAGWAGIAFELGRNAWIWVLLAAGVFVWWDLARPAPERNPSLHWLGILSIPTFIITTPWALSRIDPSVLSRTGALSAVAVLQLLPVMLLMRYRQAGPTKKLLLYSAVTIGLLNVHDARPLALVAKARGVRIVPRTIELVRGGEIGLPNLGTVMPGATLAEAQALRAALRQVLRPGDTYFNLTIASAFYFFENLPVPTLSAEYVAAASGETQSREFEQLRQNPPAAVLVGSHQERYVPASLHSYYLYRELIRDYLPVDVNGFHFLLRPDRVAPGSISDASRVHLLDQYFRTDDWERIPSAWGRSWKTLLPRFDEVARVASVTRNVSEGNSSARAFTYDIANLHLAGHIADFVKLDFAPGFAGPCPDCFMSAELRWKVAGAWSSPVRMIASFHTLLLPVGSQPEWLLANPVEAFEITVKGSRFEMTGAPEATLLHLRPM